VDFWRALNRQPANLGARLVLDNVRANPDFFRAGRVTVRVESIPDTGEAPLAAPLLLSSAPADIVAGTVSVDLPPMAVGQVLRVTLLPLEGGVPDSPLAFTTSAVGQMVSLQWSARLDGPPATGYLLEVGSAPDTANLLSLPLGNVTRFQSPAPNGVYHLRLRATNAAGAGRPTASQRVEVGCLAPPGRPLALRGTVAGPVVALTWQRGAGVIDRYVIEAGRAPGLSSIASLVIAAQSTAFQAEAPPGTYFLRVRAANDCGLSGPSAEIFLVVGAAVALPGEPGTPTVTVSGSTVSLGWVAPATGGAPTGYQLEAGTQPELADVAVATLAATPAFVTSGVPRGTYYVRLRGINQAGVGPPSADAAVVVR
jgi:predicted phage tail protein